jgi:hypothetical protein
MLIKRFSTEVPRDNNDVCAIHDDNTTILPIKLNLMATQLTEVNMYRVCLTPVPSDIHPISMKKNCCAESYL